MLLGPVLRAVAFSAAVFLALVLVVSGPAPMPAAASVVTPVIAQVTTPPAGTDPITDPGTVPGTVAGDAGAVSGADPVAPANTPQPTGQPLPSKRQRLADSLVAAFLLVVLVGGIASALLVDRRARRRVPAPPGTASRDGSGAAVEAPGGSH